MKPINSSSQSPFISPQFTNYYDDDDDFVNPPQSLPLTQTKVIKPTNTRIVRPSKKPKKNPICYPGKENVKSFETPSGLDYNLDLGLEDIEPNVFCNESKVNDGVSVTKKEGSGYLLNSIESRLLSRSKSSCSLGVCENVCEKVDGDSEEVYESGTTQLDMLLDLCCSEEEGEKEKEMEIGDELCVGGGGFHCNFNGKLY